jgi:hypothetical protein
MSDDEPRALCAGDDDLFLSTHPDAHEDAAAICAVCPRLELCKTDLADQLRGPYKIGVHGTLAGKLYDDGKQVTSKVSVGHCPQCGAADGERCVSANSGVPLGQPHRARQLGLPDCGICGTTFSPSRSHMRYCSKDCSAEAIREKKRRHFAAKQAACNICLAPTSATYCRSCAAKLARAARDLAS